MAKIKLTSNPTAPGPGTPASRSLRLLSVQDTADYLKVSTQTVRRLIKSGMFKIYRVRRQIRIDEADLVHYLSSS